MSNKRSKPCQCATKPHALGLCQPCYNQKYHVKRHRYLSGRHEGLVRVGVRGWGAS